ncbi:hypothetical protein TL16_g07784 [Triparma laevis f. inornata]|uniref:CobW C-terminal domain-containing protein n=1 Tax=Triparma laevis f. inornata TaxID=1714386 RepID=A0A9W7EGU8_9STRA|nr:hypothetical protein TL16_g07784 [Triparma laevis f. inornata]
MLRSSQGVHTIFDGEFQGEWEPNDKRCSKLVFIGKNLDKESLEKSFSECLNFSENAQRIQAVERVQKMDRTQQQLLSAAHRDDVHAIRQLLMAGAEVNYGNTVGQTALHIASLWGNASAVAALILAGANVNQKNTPTLGQQTAVHMCASRTTNPIGRLACAEALVAGGTDLTLQNDQGMVAYQYLTADGKDNFPALRVLLTPK